MAEYDDLGEQLDTLMKESAALKAPGIFQEKQNPGSLAAYRIQREALTQRIADMKRRYEASIGNPGAFTGRTMTGMNSAPVQALRTDSPTGLPNAGFGVPPNLDTSAAVPGATAVGGALSTVGIPRARPPARGVFADAASPQAVQSPSPPEAPELVFDKSQISPIPTQAPTPAPVAPVAPVAPAPSVPQKGLREQYMERLAGMNKPTKTGMTDEQKGMALMEAGLAIMAAASKPGARALGAIGQGGQHGLAVAREMERINRQQADKLRSEDRANIGTEFTLAGYDEDRAIRKQDKAEDRRIREEDKSESRRIREGDLTERSADRKAANERENRRIDLLKQQLDAGKVQVIENGKTGTFTLLNTTTGKTTDTGIKVKGKDDTPAEVKLLQALRRDPGLLETYKEIKGDKSEMLDIKDEGKRRAAYGQAYLKASMDPMGDISKFPTFEEYSAKMGIGTAAPREAPQAAIDFLRKNPAQKEAFRQKYGYLPAWILNGESF